METPPVWSWAIAAALAFAFLVLGMWIAGWRRSRRQRARIRTAQNGEHEAENILREHGFAIEARQSVAHWMVEVDGLSITVTVRADLLVTRKGKRFVAEVKTGEFAPDPTLPATRRQLLEYAHVFGVDRVLLVDVGARAIRSVRFRLSG